MKLFYRIKVVTAIFILALYFSSSLLAEEMIKSKQYLTPMDIYSIAKKHHQDGEIELAQKWIVKIKLSALQPAEKEKVLLLKNIIFADVVSKLLDEDLDERATSRFSGTINLSAGFNSIPYTIPEPVISNLFENSYYQLKASGDYFLLKNQISELAIAYSYLTRDYTPSDDNNYSTHDLMLPFSLSLGPYKITITPEYIYDTAISSHYSTTAVGTLELQRKFSGFNLGTLVQYNAVEIMEELFEYYNGHNSRFELLYIKERSDGQFTLSLFATQNSYQDTSVLANSYTSVGTTSSLVSWNEEWETNFSGTIESKSFSKAPNQAESFARKDFKLSASLWFGHTLSSHFTIYSELEYILNSSDFDSYENDKSYSQAAITLGLLFE